MCYRVSNDRYELFCQTVARLGQLSPSEGSRAAGSASDWPRSHRRTADPPLLSNSPELAFSVSW